MYKFGSHYHGESKDIDVVVVAKNIPSKIPEVDLHIIDPDTLQPLYPKTATLTPEIFRMCMKYCSELPMKIKDKILIDLRAVKQDAYAINKQAVEWLINTLLDPMVYDEDIPYLAAKWFFKLNQSYLIVRMIDDLEESDYSLLFYKSGLLELLNDFDLSEIEDLLIEYNMTNKILQLASRKYRQSYIKAVYYRGLKENIKKVTIDRNIIFIRKFIELAGTDDTITVVDCRQIEEEIKDLFNLSDDTDIKFNNNTALKIQKTYVGTMWG